MRGKEALIALGEEEERNPRAPCARRGAPTHARRFFAQTQFGRPHWGLRQPTQYQFSAGTDRMPSHLTWHVFCSCPGPLLAVIWAAMSSSALLHKMALTKRQNSRSTPTFPRAPLLPPGPDGQAFSGGLQRRRWRTAPRCRANSQPRRTRARPSRHWIAPRIGP